MRKSSVGAIAKEGAEPLGAAAVGKALALMLAVAGDEGRSPVSALAAELGLAPSSARRLIAALAAAGVIGRIAHGRYAAGPALERHAERFTARARLVRVCEAPLRRLARGAQATAHLGVLEGDMVTYVARETVDPDFAFTQVGIQFEAYCTAIGKMLLAGLPKKGREDFLAAGPFVPITANTLTDAASLRAEIIASARRGWAVDEAELFDDLRCIAAPVRRGGKIMAAVSLSRVGGPVAPERRRRDLERLRACVDDIAAALG